MRKQRKPLSLKDRFAVLVAGGFRCSYCGKKPPQAVLQIDHITPVAAGGTNDRRNLAVACTACNQGKAAVQFNPDPAWEPLFASAASGRCAGDRHAAAWREYPVAAPDGSVHELAMVCSKCNYIVAKKTLWTR